jgi:hypothetical protein
MSRLKGEDTARLEDLEGDLGCLAHVRVYVQLITLRVDLAARQGQQGLLGPALQDLCAIEALVLKVQGRMRARIREEINPHE